MAQAVQGRARRCARQPKKWAAKNAKDGCKCGQSTNRGALRSKIRCESNSRRIEYEQGNSVTDCKGKFGNEKNFRKNGASNLDTWSETNVSFTFHLTFYTIQRCLIGPFPVMKHGVFNTTRKQNHRACSGKQRIHLSRKKHACLGHRSRPCLCVFSITRG